MQLRYLASKLVIAMQSNYQLSSSLCYLSSELFGRACILPDYLQLCSIVYTAYHSANPLLKYSLKCLTVLYPDSCPYPESVILTFEVCSYLSIQCKTWPILIYVCITLHDINSHNNSPACNLMCCMASFVICNIISYYLSYVRSRDGICECHSSENYIIQQTSNPVQLCVLNRPEPNVPA